MSRHIHRLGPGLAIVIAAGQNQLSCLLWSHTLMRTPPCTLIAASMCPQSRNPDRMGLGVKQNARVTHSVLCGRKPSRILESQRHTHLFPCAATVHTSTQTYINMFLQIDRTIVADIIYSQQRTFASGYQTRNTISRYTVVTSMANTNPHTMDNITRRNDLYRSFLPIQSDRKQIGPDLCLQRCYLSHLQTDPEEIYTRKQIVITF